MNSAKKVRGVGVNDAGYQVITASNGKRLTCPYYQKWACMLTRCYSEKYQSSYPSYAGCSVCDEWLYFSVFKSWMERQDWHGKHLDKDLLVKGNKVYSPESCIFVTEEVNNFITDRSGDRGPWPVGVDLNKKSGKFRAKCSDLGKGIKHIGMYETPEQAHIAYSEYKKSIARDLASLQDDTRVRNAILRFYGL